MRVIAHSKEEVGLILTQAEAALLVAALSAHNIKSLDSSMSLVFGQIVVDPMKHVMPMFDWLKKWVKGEL